MQDATLGLSGLFISAFISSTIAPGGSEAVLAFMVSEDAYQIPLLVMIATIGNTLGALTTWYLGSLAARKYPVEALLSQKKTESRGLGEKMGSLGVVVFMVAGGRCWVLFCWGLAKVLNNFIRVDYFYREIGPLCCNCLGSCRQLVFDRCQW